MKLQRFLKLLTTGLIACLLTACGAKSDTVTAGEGQPADVPATLPLLVGEAPITTMSSPQYPDPVMVDVILKDLTNGVNYDLEDYALDSFPVCSGCDYSLVLTMHSDGDPIENIRLTVEEPYSAENGGTTFIWFNAYNRETTQTLMIARIILATDSGAPTLTLSKDATALCESGVYLGDISDPLEIFFDFHVE